MMKRKVLLFTFSIVLLQSQLAQLPLLFTPFSYPLPPIVEGQFISDKEFNLRDGLPNVVAKMKRGEPIMVGFLGGSITYSNESYRNQTLQYIQRQFPNLEMYGINAGVPGTGTELGAFRLKEQILDYNPDLVFVEFAVNGGSTNALEGIVRQIIQHNPKTDICFIYTILASQTSNYLNGNIPNTIKLYDALANYYNLPSIHFGYRIAQMEKDGLLVGTASAGSVKDKIIFTNDGTHPTLEGGNIYAQSIAYAWKYFVKNAIEKPHVLPEKMVSDNWDLATMSTPVKSAILSEEWKIVPVIADKRLVNYKNWFSDLAVCNKVGGSMTIKFIGDKIGLFDIGGPEVGIVEVEVDGVKVEEDDRFNSNCNNRYRGQYFFTNLLWGEHTIVFKLSPKQSDKVTILGPNQLTDITANPEKYAKQELYIGRILLRGKLITSGTSLNNQQANNIKLSPNPVHDTLNLRFEDKDSKPKAISIFNSIGKKEYVQTLTVENEIKMDVADFQNGVYFCRFEKDKYIEIIKFFKQ